MNEELIAEIDKYAAQYPDTFGKVDEAERLLQRCRAALSLPAPQGAVEALRQCLATIRNSSSVIGAELVVENMLRHAMIKDAETPQTPAETDLVKRLRNTPNWLRQDFGNWKDSTSHYDRAPFEAADLIEHQQARIAELESELDKAYRAFADVDTRLANIEHAAVPRDKDAYHE